MSRAKRSAVLGGQGTARVGAGPVDEVAMQALKICPKLLIRLQQERPELVVLYMHRCEYLDPKYPSVMRLHNANEILFATYLMGVEVDQ